MDKDSADVRAAAHALLDRLYTSFLPSNAALPHASVEWKDARAKADALRDLLVTPSPAPAVAEAIAAERERCAKIADNISRAAAGEVRLYDSYGGPSLPGRAREVAREQAATEIAAAIRANGGEG